MKKIAPSILSADFSHLGEEIAAVEAAGADWIHIDVMDGHFVPNITIGPPVIRSLRKVTLLPFDVHLMIDKPEAHLDAFIDAGCNLLTVHLEAASHLHRTLSYIKERGVQAGVSLNPATPLALLEDILPDLDLLLIMTVNPGFGGQQFIASMLPKIRKAKALISTVAPCRSRSGWRSQPGQSFDRRPGRSGCPCCGLGRFFERGLCSYPDRHAHPAEEHSGSIPFRLNGSGTDPI